MTGGLAMGGNNMSGVGTLTATTNNSTNTGATTLQGDITANNKNITGVATISATTNNSTNTGATTLTGDITASGHNIKTCGEVRSSNFNLDVDGDSISVGSNAFLTASHSTTSVDLNNYTLQNVNTLKIGNGLPVIMTNSAGSLQVNATTLNVSPTNAFVSSDKVLANVGYYGGQASGNSYHYVGAGQELYMTARDILTDGHNDILLNKTLNMNNQNLTNGGTISASSISCSGVLNMNSNNISNGGEIDANNFNLRASGDSISCNGTASITINTSNSTVTANLTNLQIDPATSYLTCGAGNEQCFEFDDSTGNNRIRAIKGLAVDDTAVGLTNAERVASRGYVKLQTLYFTGTNTTGGSTIIGNLSAGQVAQYQGHSFTRKCFINTAGDYVDAYTFTQSGATGDAIYCIVSLTAPYDITVFRVGGTLNSIDYKLTIALNSA